MPEMAVSLRDRSKGAQFLPVSDGAALFLSDLNRRSNHHDRRALHLR
jgi:hypothetical protein